MSDFKVGDKVEIVFHAKSEYKGKLGKISYIGKGLMQGTNPLENNINVPNPDARYIVALEGGTVLSDIWDTQIRKT